MSNINFLPPSNFNENLHVFIISTFNIISFNQNKIVSLIHWKKNWKKKYLLSLKKERDLSQFYTDSLTEAERKKDLKRKNSTHNRHGFKPGTISYILVHNCSISFHSIGACIRIQLDFFVSRWVLDFQCI